MPITITNILEDCPEHQHCFRQTFSTQNDDEITYTIVLHHDDSVDPLTRICTDNLEDRRANPSQVWPVVIPPKRQPDPNLIAAVQAIAQAPDCPPGVLLNLQKLINAGF